MVIGFILISVWWQNADHRIPDGDYGKHLLIALGYYDVIKEGYLGNPFRQYNQYPPLTHLVGAYYSLFAGGPSIVRMVVGENLVFAPLLGFGCYWAGRVTFGRLAGVLAAAFALGTPMLIALFHDFMTDGPTAAMVAITVAAMLASDRFANARMAAVAGLLGGVGMYSRSTFPLFIAGLFLVMVMRGGWRNRKGLLLFLGVGFLIAGPWYILHFHDLQGLTNGTINPHQQPAWYDSTPYPSRTELFKYTWYGWAMINTQLYLPLVLFFVIGLVGLSFGWLRNRSPDSYVPELVVGGFVAYITTSLMTLQDPRYTIPAIVYVAVLGTGWITRLRVRSLRLAVAALLVGIVVINTTQTNKDWPGWHTVINLPNAKPNPIYQGSLTVFQSYGYIISQPEPSPVRDLLLRFMKGIKRDGATSVVFDGSSLNSGGYNLNSLTMIARLAGLQVPGYWTSLVTTPQIVWVYRTSPDDARHALGNPHGAGAPFCLASPGFSDGTGLYVIPGPLSPNARIRCPKLASA
jgi:hypothetical protein